MYKNDINDIVLTVNSNLEKWKFCLIQLIKNNWQQYVCRYDNELWLDTEFSYNTKKKCWELLKTLKKIQTYLYRVFFVIKLDTQTLVTQLNRSVTDVSETLINKWLA